jgi:hypothetical protein
MTITKTIKYIGSIFIHTESNPYPDREYGDGGVGGPEREDSSSEVQDIDALFRTACMNTSGIVYGFAQGG